MGWIMNKIIENIIKRDKNLTILEALSETIENEKLDFDDVISIVKKDKVFLEMLKAECNQLGLLKSKNKSIDIEKLLEGK